MDLDLEIFPNIFHFCFSFLVSRIIIKLKLMMNNKNSKSSHLTFWWIFAVFSDFQFSCKQKKASAAKKKKIGWKIFLDRKKLVEESRTCRETSTTSSLHLLGVIKREKSSLAKKKNLFHFSLIIHHWNPSW